MNCIFLLGTSSTETEIKRSENHLFQIVGASYLLFVTYHQSCYFTK